MSKRSRTIASSTGVPRHSAVHYVFTVIAVRARTAHARTLAVALAPGQLLLEHHAFGRG